MNDDDDIDNWVAAVATAPPGPDLGAALAGIDVDGLSAHDLVVVARAWQRQQAYTDAQQLQVLATLVGCAEYQRCSCPTDSDIAHTHRAVEPAGDEVSLALAWSPARAKNTVVTAVELTEELPDTLEALRSGRIDVEKARLIADRTRSLGDPDLRRRVEARVLPTADSKTRAQLDYRLRRAVIAVDPAAAEQRRRDAAKDRRVSRPEPASSGGEDGMAHLDLYGPAEDLTALWTAIDAAARHARTTGDDRTLHQLQFDLLTGIGWTGLDLGHLGCCNPTCTSEDTTVAGSTGTGADAGPGTNTSDGARVDADSTVGTSGAGTGTSTASSGGGVRLGRRRGKAATVNVTVAASTLFGVDEQPGWLDGYGPITAHAGRGVAAEASLRRLLTDPIDGHLLEYGRTTYTPPAELARFVAARDRTCRHDDDRDATLACSPAQWPKSREFDLVGRSMPQHEQLPAVQKLRVRFAKRGRLRFTSHRDFQRAFERALRRADVPMAYSHGFTPHPKVSYAGASPTGAASEAEYLELSVARVCDPDELRAALDHALPAGLDVIEVVLAGQGALADRLQASSWQIGLPGAQVAQVSAAVETFLAAGSVEVERLTKNGMRRLDPRAAVLSASVGETDPVTVVFVVQHQSPTVRPEEVLAGLRVAAGLVAPAPPQVVRLGQGRWDDAVARLDDPLAPDRG